MPVSSGQSQFQSPRISFVWITLAQLVCTLPHVFYIPVWVSLFSAWCVFWRWMVFQGRWNYPSKYARYALVILAIFGLMLYFPTILSIQAAVTLLVITYYMKLLEMFRLKDVYVILTLSYFIIASAFLFQDDIAMSAYFVVAFIFTTVALVSSNRTESKLKSGGSFKLGLTLCLQAAPIGLCLFLLFPRFDPFWALDMRKEGPSVGISDTMSPADVAELGAAEGIAFRVEFDGNIPPPQDRYWRVLTLSSFNGVDWRTLFGNIQEQIVFTSMTQLGDKVLSQGLNYDRYEYRISLEPTQQHWLPTLDRPLSVSEKSYEMPDFSILVEKPITSITGYSGVSAPAMILDPDLNHWLRQRHLELPIDHNLKTIQYAIDTFQSLGGDHLKFIDHVMKNFQEEAFYYTLKPGKYGKDSIDEFLFERRKGFCAHYASAMAVLLRSVGIPTRVVIGYHGGEINPLGGHLVVHQYEAHAWVEAWIQGQGWVRYDPTAMVAPWRLLLGIEEMMRQSSTTEVPSLRDSIIRSNPFANKVRLFFDYSNYRWNKYVVNFDQEAQQELFEQYFDQFDMRTMMMVMLSLIFGFLAILSFFLLWISRVRVACKVDRALFRLLRALEKKYTKRHAGATLQQYFATIEHQLTSEEHRRVSQVVSLYSRWSYAPLQGQEKQAVMKQMRLEIRLAQRTVQHIF